MWIGTVTGPVTLPLREAHAINFIHVGGEGNNDCSNVVRIFPIKGIVSQASHSKHCKAVSGQIGICGFTMDF